MFRKPKRTAKKAGLRQKDAVDKNDDADDDDDNEEPEGKELELARKRLKHHKILSSMPLTNGGGGGATKGDNATGEGHATAAAKEKQEKLNSAGGELSVLASKHQENMEQFIAQQLGGAGAGAVGEGTLTSKDKTDNMGNEDELYQQLAKEALIRTRGENAGNNGGVGGDAGGAASSTAVDEDKGDGGAVLVGAGIAEVILPVQERLYSSSTTTYSGGGGGGQSRQYRVNRKDTASSSAVPEGERQVPLKTTAPFRTMIRSGGGGGAAGQRQPTNYDNDKNSDKNNSNGESSAGVSASASSRQGFAAFRGKPDDSYGNHQQQHSGGTGRGGDGATGYRKKNRDDQMFSNYVHRHFEEKRK
jgi:hypothetical protein